MAERPKLPLETEAAIEREREKILELANNAYLLVFQSDLARSLRILQGSSHPLSQFTKPASLKLELRRYSSALFDAEARHYAKHASSEYQMRLWLHDLALCIENEVTQEVQKHSAAHDFHCTASERRQAIVDGLRERGEHWIKVAETDTAAIIARSKVLFAQAEEVLAKFDAPCASIVPLQAMQSQSQPPQTIQETRFQKRAEWTRTRLRERGWDHNDPFRFGGPDRKTILKILSGKAVKEETLDRLVTALNKSKKAPGVKLLDIPND